MGTPELFKNNIDDIIDSLFTVKRERKETSYSEWKQQFNMAEDVLEVENLSASLDGVKLFSNVSFIINRGDKVALLGKNDLAKTALLKILTPD